MLSEEEFEQLHTWDAQDIKEIQAWARDLEDFGVFFSSPLDLDMAMLLCFPEAYRSIVPDGYGPRIPSMDTPQYRDYLENATQTVLGETGPEHSVYSSKLQESQQLFPWYRYLFLGKSKPSTHLLALSQIDDEKLASIAPPVLKRLLHHVNNQLRLDKKDTP